MSKLPAQEYRPFETEESSWEPCQPYQRSDHPDFDQDSYEESGLYTDVQFGLGYQAENLETNRELQTIPNLYALQDPGVFAHPSVPYPTEVPTLSRYETPSTLHTDRALFFPTGAIQAYGMSEASYHSPITDEFPPFESSMAHPILQTTENLERAEDEEEEGVGVVLSYSGKGAWKCAICSKSFRRRRRAVLHVLNKHKNTRIRCNGACGIADCDRSFATQEGLDVHIRPVTVECSSWYVIMPLLQSLWSLRPRSKKVRGSRIPRRCG
ncbi:hypothetical protein FS842_000294 [Serendipita sp. 407]|nr:hypothetical protein FS842_000294 [Serendipita sp. 407]